jgi:glycosyltransferase involved in cell wall biosynthesis
VSAPAGAGPAVDIVITNHDYGRFLREALESACSQTHPGVRVIAVDDGSSDESRGILAEYGDRVEVVLKDCGGQASALNAGIERCRGEVLLLLDADDRLHPEAAARVAAALDADPALAKVQFPMRVVDALGAATGASKPASHLSAPHGDLRRAELAFPFDIPWLPGGGTAFRTSLVRRIMPIPEHDYPRFGADWYLIHLTALLGGAGVLEQPCADYRVHGANAYELDLAALDLGHVRDSIRLASVTAASLARLADELDLPRPRRILSVADLANRLISLRLDRRGHPLPGDTRLGLLRDGLSATRRRFDVSWPMKAIFGSWFALTAAAPRSLSRRLAELFLFPERRRLANGVLARLQRGWG